MGLRPAIQSTGFWAVLATDPSHRPHHANVGIKSPKPATKDQHKGNIRWNRAIYLHGGEYGSKVLTGPTDFGPALIDDDFMNLGPISVR